MSALPPPVSVYGNIALRHSKDKVSNKDRADYSRPRPTVKDLDGGQHEHATELQMTQ